MDLTQNINDDRKKTKKTSDEEKLINLNNKHLQTFNYGAQKLDFSHNSSVFGLVQCVFEPTGQVSGRTGTTLDSFTKAVIINVDGEASLTGPLDADRWIRSL